MLDSMLIEARASVSLSHQVTWRCQWKQRKLLAVGRNEITYKVEVLSGLKMERK